MTLKTAGKPGNPGVRTLKDYLDECRVLEYQKPNPGMMESMSNTYTILIYGLLLACCSLFTVIPAHAFTANSLDIVVSENGDAVATFRFTLEGFIENAIPQSMLEEELTKGLTTGSDPPELKSMDRSSAVLFMKKFADTSDVPTGKEYRTATMDFKKAEIALQNSGLGDAVTADFSPATITLSFPDGYKWQFSNADVLPAVFHTVEDPVKVAQVQAQATAQAQVSPGSTTTPVILTSSAAKGSINVTSSPQNVKVSIDSRYIGESPALFQDIPAGTHVMEFSSDGYSPVSKTVLVNAGKTTNIMVVLTYIPAAATADEPSSSFPWLPVLLVITGLVVIGIGGYYSWSEKTRKDREVREIRKGNGAVPETRKPAPVIIPDGTATNPQNQKPEPVIIKDDSTSSAGARTPDMVIIPDKAPDTGNCPIPQKEQNDEDTGDECR
jgi:hypothetical protein